MFSGPGLTVAHDVMASAVPVSATAKSFFWVLSILALLIEG
jgi:hypothetical protein